MLCTVQWLNSMRHRIIGGGLQGIQWLLDSAAMSSAAPAVVNEPGPSSPAPSSPAASTCHKDKDPEPSCSKAAACEVCHFDRLSDPLVVSILKHLDKEEIAFLLPQVCKRWSTLAIAEDLWKDCHLFYDPYMSDSNKRIFFKFLNMVPILRALTLELEYKDKLEFLTHWKGNNPREISDLEFIYDNMPPIPMFKFLEKYKDSVTKLIISDTHTPYVATDVKKIWSHIQNLSKLKHLIIDGAGLLEHRAKLVKDAPCWKSLQVLDVKDCCYEDMNTVQRVISHNLNWTEVYLGSCYPNDFRGEVKALSKCVNLDTIQIPFCKELKLLESCGQLDSLIIDCLRETVKEVKLMVRAMNKSTFFPNLSKLKMIGIEGDYVALLKCIVQNHPKISHLNLVSCKMNSKEVVDVLSYSANLEKFYLYEMDNMTVITIVNEILDGRLPKLCEVSVHECSCDNIEFCSKRALTQLQEHSQSIHVVAESMVCSCRPAEAIPIKYPKKRKQDNSESMENRKKLKTPNKKNNSSKKTVETKIDNASQIN